MEALLHLDKEGRLLVESCGSTFKSPLDLALAYSRADKQRVRAAIIELLTQVGACMRLPCVCTRSCVPMPSV